MEVGKIERWNVKYLKYLLAIIFAIVIFCGFDVAAQEPTAPSGGGATQRQGGGWGQGEGGARPTFGKITSIANGVLTISKQDGSTVTVKLTEQTEFRKDGNKANAADFKVGDMVMVRGEENADHSISARVIGTRSGGGANGGAGGPSARMMGTLGKDYVAGEIKGIDAPKLTILRTDNVTQTIELNEETSLRKGRESVTMADIHIGDHVVARGAVQNDVFVPKGVMVMNEEQWKRVQEMAAQNGPTKPAGAGTEATPPKPQE
jgi:hypothetical protein